MKAYGVKRQDHARDCTAIGKFGSKKLLSNCSCGKSEARPACDNKSRKAKERQLIQKIKLWINF